MKTMLKSSLALLLLTMAACGKSETSAPTGHEPTSTETVVSSAPLAPGDLVPGKLFPIPVDVSKLANVRLQDSFAASPKDKVGWDFSPKVEFSKAALVQIPAGSKEGNVAVAIDSTDGSSISIVPHQGGDGYESTLKDLQVFEPTGRLRIDQRLAKLDALTATSEQKPLATIDLDAKMTRGLYVVKVGSVASKQGVAIWAYQPNSKIMLEATPSANQVFAGEKATAKIKITDDGVPVAGAALEGSVETPDGKSLPVTFADLGGGTYEANVSDAIGTSTVTGFYDVKVRAKGVSNTVKFDRSVSTSLQYVVPTGKILSASAPREVVNAAGLIEAFDIDIKVEAATTDRFEINGMLAVQMNDGTERPLVLSQTADTLGAGTHTITLHFDAGYLGLAKLEGPVNLRTLSLFSQGTKATLQRHLRGLDIKLPTLQVSKLAPMKQVTPAVNELIQSGGFDLTK
jgi:hypothetical protein